MTDDPRDSVSEITENTDKKGFVGDWHFLVSLAWGTLAGTVSLLSFAALEVEGVPIDTLFSSVVFFGLFVGLFTLAGMLVVGLPITALLKAIGAEKVWLYTVLGGTIGFVALAIMFELWRGSDLLFIPCSAAIAGAACSFRWGRWREWRAKEKQAAAKAAAKAARRAENPFHDMIY